MPKSEKTKARSRSSSEAPAFDIDVPKLPKAIEDAALGSGSYPYDKRMRREPFEAELLLLQTELVKLQAHLAKSGERIVVVFEGRDAAGKGSCIGRFRQHLNPRQAHVVALTKPTETERGQWYFQRYVVHLPTAGNMALFDRSCAGFSDASMHGLSARHNGWRRRSAKARSRGR
jgi:polyphosphate kinase 2 (PPK2 family)